MIFTYGEADFGVSVFLFSMAFERLTLTMGWMDDLFLF